MIVVDKAESISKDRFECFEDLRTPDDEEVGPNLALIYLADERRLPARLQSAEVSSTLSALQPRELQRYVEARLMNAGFEGDAVFPLATCRAIHSATLGIPSGVDLLCTTLMVEAARRRASVVDPELVATLCSDAEAPALRLPKSVDASPRSQTLDAETAHTPDSDLPREFGADADTAEPRGTAELGERAAFVESVELADASELPADRNDLAAKRADSGLGPSVPGASEDWPFTPQALQKIHQVSSGCPRVICSIADLALVVGRSAGVRMIDLPQVSQAYADLEKRCSDSFPYYHFLQNAENSQRSAAAAASTAASTAVSTAVSTDSELPQAPGLPVIVRQASEPAAMRVGSKRRWLSWLSRSTKQKQPAKEKRARFTVAR